MVKNLSYTLYSCNYDELSAERILKKYYIDLKFKEIDSFKGDKWKVQL